MSKSGIKARALIKMENNKTYKYNNRLPVHVDETTLTHDQLYKLTESKTFCILPWIHLHGFPDGRAYPCCFADMWSPVGDLRKSTMQEVWNDTPMKTLRKNMLEDKPCKECTKCYELEETGFFSMRNSFSRDFGHHINLIDNTNPDGLCDDFKIIKL
jgi:hypothetical protein